MTHLRRKVCTRFPGQSGLAPDDLTTVPHLSVSSATNFPKSAAQPGNTVVPRSARRAFILASASAMLISLFSVETNTRNRSPPVPFDIVLALPPGPPSQHEQMAAVHRSSAEETRG